MSDQISAIKEALDAARLAAQSIVQPAANALAVPTQGAVAVLPQGGRAVSMREMVQETGVRSDAFLKVTPAGFTVGKDTKTFFDEIEVEFRVNTAKAFYGLRYGNPAKYEKSFDRILDSRTKRPWADRIAEGQRIDPRCTGDYPAVEVSMTSIKQLDAKGGGLLLEAGKTLSWTSSITNWSEWVKFIEPIYVLQDAGLLANNVLVRGKIVHDQRTKEGNTWGILMLNLDVADLGLPPEAVEAQAAA